MGTEEKGGEKDVTYSEEKEEVTLCANSCLLCLNLNGGKLWQPFQMAYRNTLLEDEMSKHMQTCDNEAENSLQTPYFCEAYKSHHWYVDCKGRNCQFLLGKVYTSIYHIHTLLSVT